MAPACVELPKGGNGTTHIPRDTSPDSTLALLREGYRFIPERCRRHGSDVFRTRIMLRAAWCFGGREAAEVFYTLGRLTRQGAMPVPTLKLLQDFGSVQMLDWAAHAHRKRMFMGIMSEAAIARLVALTEEDWRAFAARAAGREVALLDAAQRVLCGAVCRWAGITLTEDELDRRTREFAAMVEQAGTKHPLRWSRAALLRHRNERWARAVIRRLREDDKEAVPDVPARIIAEHRDLEGKLLDPQEAAVELINVLRPTVAVAHFIVHAALALHEHPGRRERLRDAGDAEIEAFVQEVRRLAPFFPFIGGRARQPFELRGRRFGEGDWLLLDIYGTNRDPAVWDDPQAFRPERFIGREIGPWDMIPQGGGPFVEGHRCPGEWITIALMKQAARFLARDLHFDVPEQDMSVDLSRPPAAPASRFVLRIRQVEA